MRPHLLKILLLNVIEHFPQDLKEGKPHKVLPLAVIKIREKEAARLRLYRLSLKKERKRSSNDKKHQNLLAKRRKIYQENKEINREKKQVYYRNNKDKICIKKKRDYYANSTYICSQKKKWCYKNLENNRVKNREYKNKNKNLIKRRYLYYESKRTNSTYSNKKQEIVKNITKKYESFWCRSSLLFRKNFIEKNIYNNLKIKVKLQKN
ncbi:hypothetical protein PUN28_017958 [Cardiocondyla obscurior]|uniref:Uncharacterized protein n=1 Tax=Cardiocondyla obscurior TaxID=286306 RepID=A0AAW2EF98_9HYME